MPLPLLTLAAQAAGLFSYAQGQRGNRRQQRILNEYEREVDFNASEALSIAEMNYQNTDLALQLEKDELKGIMEQEALQFTEGSIANTEELRGVLASQRAILSARGTNVGQGSARAIQEASLHAFNEDERARALSQNFRKLMFGGQMSLYDIKRGANKINKFANINSIRGNQASTKASIGQTRAQLKTKSAQATAGLFKDIMGGIPFAEFGNLYGYGYGGGLNAQGNSPGFNPGLRLTEAQRNRLIGRL